MSKLTEFHWMRYTAPRSTSITKGVQKYVIKTGDIFGVAESTKAKDKLYLKEFEVLLTVDISVSDKLIDRAKPYRGKVTLPKQTPNVLDKYVTQLKRCKSDTARLQLQTEYLAQTKNKPTLRAKIKAIPIKQEKDKTVKVSMATLPKATLNKIVSHPLGYKLSQVEFPETEEFVDSEIPSDILKNWSPD